MHQSSGLTGYLQESVNLCPSGIAPAGWELRTIEPLSQVLHLGYLSEIPLRNSQTEQQSSKMPLFLKRLYTVLWRKLSPEGFQTMCVLVTQLCLTPCNTMDRILPGSSIHGILQARILEWVAISFSKGSFQPRDRTWVSCIAGRCFTAWATREAMGLR